MHINLQLANKQSTLISSQKTCYSCFNIHSVWLQLKCLAYIFIGCNKTNPSPLYFIFISETAKFLHSRGSFVTYLTQNVLAVQDVSKPLVAKHRIHIISVKKEFVFTRKLLIKLLLLSSFLVTLEKFKLQFKNNLFLYFIIFLTWSSKIPLKWRCEISFLGIRVI